MLCWKRRHSSRRENLEIKNPEEEAILKLQINKNIDNNAFTAYAELAAGCETNVLLSDGSQTNDEPKPIDIKIIDGKAIIKVKFETTPKTSATSAFTLHLKYSIDGEEKEIKIEGCSLKYTAP